jgi:hypothetical protein
MNKGKTSPRYECDNNGAEDVDDDDSDGAGGGGGGYSSVQADQLQKANADVRRLKKELKTKDDKVMRLTEHSMMLGGALDKARGEASLLTVKLKESLGEIEAKEARLQTLLKGRKKLKAKEKELQRWEVELNSAMASRQGRADSSSGSKNGQHMTEGEITTATLLALEAESYTLKVSDRSLTSMPTPFCLSAFSHPQILDSLDLSSNRILAYSFFSCFIASPPFHLLTISNFSSSRLLAFSPSHLDCAILVR